MFVLACLGASPLAMFSMHTDYDRDADSRQRRGELGVPSLLSGGADVSGAVAVEQRAFRHVGLVTGATSKKVEETEESLRRETAPCMLLLHLFCVFLMRKRPTQCFAEGGPASNEVDARAVERKFANKVCRLRACAKRVRKRGARVNHGRVKRELRQFIYFTPFLLGEK